MIGKSGERGSARHDDDDDDDDISKRYVLKGFGIKKPAMVNMS